MSAFTRRIALLLGACSLPWAGVSARAADAQDTVSVGDRFNALHLAPGFAVEGWDVRPSASLRGGYDDNITSTSSNVASSAAMEMRGSIDASQQMGPYALAGSALLKHTWYLDAGDNNATEGNLRGAVAIDLAPQLVLRGSAALAVGVEGGSSNGIVVDGVFDYYDKRDQFRRVPLDAAVEYHIGRIGLRGSLHLEAVNYAAQTTRSGLRIAQDFRNGWEGEAALRGSYEVYPHLSAFVDVRDGARRYADANGDSDTWRAVAGGSVELTRLLIGEAYAGYAGQSFPNGGERTGLSYGAQLHWFATPLLSLTLDASREFRAEVDTTAAGVTSAIAVTQDAVSLRGEWEPWRRLLVYAQAGYTRQERASVDRSDELVSLIAGATYLLTGELNLQFEYEFEGGNSNFSGDFTRNRLTLGVAAAY